MLVLIFLCLLGVACGQPDTATTHSIDGDLEKCLASEKNFTTGAMAGCITHASAKWAGRLNAEYDSLQVLLTDDQRNKLRTAQTRWMTYRDSELEFSKQLYSDMGGTIQSLNLAQDQLNVTKSRALELAAHLSVLTNGKAPD